MAVTLNAIGRRLAPRAEARPQPQWCLMSPRNCPSFAASCRDRSLRNREAISGLSLSITLALSLALGLALPSMAFAEGIAIADAYARAVPPGQPNSAAFMTLTNAGEQDRALITGESDAAEVVELHRHRMEDGMMRMRQVEQIALPAGETVTLAPGGLHVMLIGLTKTLAPGDQIELTLGFDDGSLQTLNLPVRRIDPSAMPAHKHH
ncbi:MAG: copper chaperone PCu(A)C [Lamprobacter sp.]|uniref:copper chaperone PCu(A)C n=1 Tax=Lamprobacter sp. TaxID=3100796 RepID=UPI002B25FA93|nr:copper chaperone PCu(A)C [Lamprobacter sp.]MEA3639342.1 copper chaperone PCu(A)C [Lamprobacter sp.]